MRKTSLIILLVCCTVIATAQHRVKNVIYMIGDGMSITHVTAAMLSKGSPLAIERANYVGMQKTRSLHDEVTDSAASGTALSCGQKTYNGAIGVDDNKQPMQSIRERAQNAGMKTGVVATYSVTNATPAAFVAHNESRSNEFAIAEDYLSSGIDLFIGGGVTFFEKRKDDRNLANEMKANGYQIVHSMDELKTIESGRVGALLADNALPRIAKGRGNMLPEATDKALELLSADNKKGFFVMIEGSQIDGAGHDNNGQGVVEEVIDFDNAIKVAMDFADRNLGTLVVITADHETGGMTLPADGKKTIYKFTTGGHSGVMVPVYAYGAGAEKFTGIMDNTDIPKRIAEVLKINW